MDQPSLQSDSTSLYNDLKKGYKLRSHLSEITDGLQLYDKLSVIFLLCESPESGVAIIDSILKHTDTVTQNNLFHKWLRRHLIFTSEDWPEKLAELLTIIQNYKLLKTLGFAEKRELIERFKPKDNFKTYWVSPVRKALYNLCDELKTDECRSLITVTEGSRNLTYTLKCKCLEYILLTWSEKQVINLGNEKVIDLDALVKSLHHLNLNHLAHDIEIIVEKTNCQMLRSKYSLKLETELSEYYNIYDPKKPGLCVIINEKNFTSSLLPKRWGTDKDAERLIEVFTAFGFNVKLHSDLSYDQLIHTLRFYAKTVDKTSSYFVLIILSHGSENIIFTSDSLPIDMNTIEMTFQAKICQNLIGKPKIFIVQACQGQQWQKVMKDSKPDIDTDNCVSSPSIQPGPLGPQRGDSMIAWSTVQGFASFRDKYNGSWYIQELCNELWKFGDTFDLVEILTKVNNNLRSKIYGSQFMVPSLLLSLRAKVQLPTVKENFTRARKLMFERLIFEKYFKEFLMMKGAHNLQALKTTA